MGVFDDILAAQGNFEPAGGNVRMALNAPGGIPSASDVVRKDRTAAQLGVTYGEVDASAGELDREAQAQSLEKVPGADAWLQDTPENIALLRDDSDALGELQETARKNYSAFVRQTAEEDARQEKQESEYRWEVVQKSWERGEILMRMAVLGNQMSATTDPAKLAELRAEGEELQRQMKALEVVSHSGLGGAIEQAPRMLTWDFEKAMEWGIAGATAAGTTAAIGAGMTGPGAIAAPIAVPAAMGAGFAGGALAGGFISARDSERGNFAFNMFLQKDDAGNYINSVEDIATAAAIYGNLSGLVEVGGDVLFAKVIGVGRMLGLGRLFPKGISPKDAIKAALMDKSFLKVFKEFGLGALKTGGVESSEEFTQEGLSAAIEAWMKQSLKDRGENFWYGDQVGLPSRETMGRMAEAGWEAFKMGPWFYLVPGTIRAGVELRNANRARVWADAHKELADKVAASKITADSPVRMESFLQLTAGMDGNVLIPADAALQMQQEGMDLCGALGWEVQDLEEAAALGQEMEYPVARLHARLGRQPDVMKRVADIMREAPESMSSKEASYVNELLEDDLDGVIEAAEEEALEQSAIEGEIERLRNEIRTAVKSVKKLYSEIMASADPETTLANVVEDNVRLLVRRAKTLNMRGNGLVSDFLSQFTVQGLVPDVNGRMVTPEQAELNAAEQGEREGMEPFWDAVWGRLDIDSLRTDFPQAPRELARKLGRGLFSRRGQGIAVDEMADELKRLGYLDEEATGSELVEKLKEMERPTWRKRAGRKQRRVSMEGLEDMRREEVFQMNMQRSIDEVRKQYEGTEQWMRAPNGQQTKLTEQQWLAVRTPEFKEWFGDWEADPANASKVVDENGEPMVMYHQSPNVFDTFRKGTRGGKSGNGIYFSARPLNRFGGERYEVFLNLRNPLTKENAPEGVLSKMGRIVTEVDTEAFDAHPEFDGAMVFPTEVTVREPNQIKSVHNRGTFDAENPNIYYQGGVAEERLNAETEAWAKTVNDFVDGKAKPRKTVTILKNTPLVFTLLDSKIDKDTRIVTDYAKLKKMLWSKHNIPQDELKKLPKALADPIMIFESATVKGDYVVMVEMKDADKATVVIPISMNFDAGRGYIVNYVFSGYGQKDTETNKPRNYWFKKQIEDGRLRYFNNKKSRQWASSSGLQLPRVGTHLTAKKKIYTEYDLVNLKEQYPTYYQRAFHGSPHRFEQFMLEHIGTGEGAQAHGWGLYFAQNRAVSEGYRDMLSRGRIFVDGQEYAGPEGTSIEALGLAANALRNASALKTKNGKINRAIRDLDDMANPNLRVDYKWNREAVAVLETLRGKDFTFDQGQLYEVEIPDDDVLLDEDKPYEEQPEKVKKALKKLGIKSGDQFFSWDSNSLASPSLTRFIESNAKTLESVKSGEHPNYTQVRRLTGGNLYFSFLVKKFGSPEAASRALNDAGIKGITYVGGRDGRCFVVFDDKSIQMIDTFYQMQEQPLNQDPADLARGMMTPMEDGQYVIQLFNNADLSTLAHEFSHAMFLDMQQRVRNGTADQQTVEDVATLNEWLDSELGDEAKLKGQYEAFIKDTPAFYGREWEFLSPEDKALVRSIAGQEMLARGWEAYLREGKAPTAKMEGVFRRFANWLKRIYRDAKRLNVELTDEVRQVFDRMIATDEEMDAAAADAGVREETKRLLDALGLKGKERLEIEGLITAAKEEAADRLRRAREKEPRERRARWMQEAREQATKEQVYIARAALRRTPLDLDMVRAAMGDAVAAELMKRLPGSVKQAGAIPEVVAAEQGYASAADMLRDIISAPTKSERVKQIVEEKQAEHDATFSPDDYLWEQEQIAEQQEKIAKALDAKIGLIVTENRGRRRIGKDQLKAAAKKYLDGQPLQKAVQAGIYRVQAGKWVREERRAILKGDWQAAADANYKARLNIELARQAAELRDTVEKTGKQAKKFLEADIKNALKYADKNQQDAWAGARFAVFLLSHNINLFDPTRKMLANAGDKSLEDIRKFLLYFGRQGYLSITMDKDGSVLCGDIEGKLFKAAVDWRTAKTSDVMPYIEAMRMIMLIDKADRKAVAESGKADFGEFTQEIADSIYAHNKRRDKGSFAKKNALVKLLREFHAAHLKADTILMLLDGDEMGPAWKAIMRPINKATWWRADRLKKESSALKKLFSVYTRRELVEMKGKRYFVKELGESITKEQALAILLNCGNADNLQRVMAGFKLANGSQLTQGQVAAIIDTLDEKDVKFAQSVWDYFETFRKESFDLQESITGVRPEAVQAQPLHTKHGDLRGGYYPIVYDKTMSAKPIDTETIGTQTGGMWASVDYGSMKQRTATGLGTPISLSLDVIPQHVAKTVHMLAFRKPVIEVSRILNARNVNAAIEETAGVETTKALQDWLHYVAGERPAKTGWSRAVGWARRNASLYTMGYKLATMLAQMTGLLASTVELGPRWVAVGLMQSVHHPVESWKLAMSASAMMRHRIHSIDREVFEQSTKMMDTGSANRLLDPMVRIKTALDKNAYVPMGWVQMVFADMPTWQGAYAKAMKENGGDSKAAAEYADSIVERTQVGGSEKDLAGVQRGTELGKLITMYYSFFSALYQLATRRITMLNRSGWKGAAEWWRLGSLAMLTWFAEPVISGLITGKAPDDDEDDGEFAKWAAKEALLNPFNMVIGVRDIASVIDSMIEGYGRGFRFSPALDVADSYINFIRQVYKTIDTGEADAKKLTLKGGKAFGQTTGLVNAQEMLLLEKLWDWLDGTDADFELGDLVRKKRK